MIRILAVIILFTVGYWGAATLQPRHQLDGGYQREYPSVNGKKLSSVFSQDQAYLDIMLTDSILSIIKNYYVDFDRIDNVTLIKDMLNGLKETLPLHYQFDGQQLSVRVGQHQLTILESDIEKYDRMLEFMVSLGMAVENYQKAQIDKDPASVDQDKKLGTFQVLHQLVLSLDAHSSLLSKNSYKELRQSTEGTFGGVGVLVGVRDRLLTVIKPIPASPAFYAGVMPSDRIIAIDGHPTYAYSLEDLVQFMRGAPGTSVRLSLLRQGAMSAQEVQIERKVVRVNSVRSKNILENGNSFLYVVVDAFSQRTSEEVVRYIDEFKTKYGKIDGLIMDLRANPGGLLDQAIRVSDLFIDDGVVVSTRGRRTEVEHTRDELYYHGFPITVLVDSESASASEIVAGALQDHQRAIVIGEPTFGKGSVQTIFELPEDRALKLTIARYFTPKGRSIQNVGIMPDIWIQPIFQSDRNLNLMGPYRYRSERFLDNHLSAESQRSSQEIASLKGYVIEKSTDKLSRYDYEFELAKMLLAKIKQKSNLDQVSDSSVVWLGLSKKMIQKQLAHWGGVVNKELMNQYEVDWKEGDREYFPAISLKINPLSHASFFAGDTVKIPFEINNSGDKAVARVSVFAKNSDGLTTYEMLLGMVPARTIRKGFLDIKIPNHWPSGQSVLNVGVAVEAKPSSIKPKNVMFFVKERTPIEFSVSHRFIDAPGGRFEQVVEPLESGLIDFTVTNQSDVPTGDLTVEVINLSGEQIAMIDHSRAVKALLPGASTHIQFAMKASDMLVNKLVNLGLFIQGKELQHPTKKYISVAAMPSKINTQINLFRYNEK